MASPLLQIGTILGEALDGASGSDSLLGAAGNDTLLGAGGNDLLIGGAGDDSLDGGLGQDKLFVGLGNDVATGGANADLFIVEAGPGSTTTITDFNRFGGDRLDVSDLVRAGATWRYDFTEGGPLDANGEPVQDGDAMIIFRLNGVEQKIIFTGAVDTGQIAQGILFGRAGNAPLVAEVEGGALSGTAAADDLIGNSGADNVFGGMGDDLLVGLGANDTLKGAAGNDTLIGGEDDDLLLGGDGADALFGSEGDDLLVGGNGDDVLTGGEGADIFRFTSLKGGVDTLVDVTSGEDKIDLAWLLPAVNEASFAAFVRVVADAPDALSGVLQIDRDGAGGRFGFETIANLGESAFALVNGQSQSVLAFDDFLI